MCARCISRSRGWGFYEQFININAESLEPLTLKFLTPHSGTYLSTFSVYLFSYRVSFCFSVFRGLADSDGYLSDGGADENNDIDWANYVNSPCLMCALLDLNFVDRPAVDRAGDYSRNVAFEWKSLCLTFVLVQYDFFQFDLFYKNSCPLMMTISDKKRWTKGR